MNSKNQSPFKVNLHELPRRAGEMKEYSLQFPAPDNIGVPLLQIPVGSNISVSFRAESVDDGVLITGAVVSNALGECGRCLDKIEMPIDQRFQELFLYASRRSENPEEDDELFVLDGDIADLEVPVRDAVILSMPLNPLCDDECEGLCSQCGEKWRDLPENHGHEVVDPRWTGLAGWSPK